VFEFVVYPSSEGDDAKGSTFAFAKFAKSTSSEEIVVESGYEETVRGHHDSYYTYRYRPPTFGQMMFAAWLFSPRPIYVRPYSYGSMYRPRSVMSGSQLTRTRQTFRTTKNVKAKPIAKKARPASAGVKGSKYAKQGKSRLKGTVKASRGSKISDRAGKAKSYKARNPARTQKGAAGMVRNKKAVAPAPSRASRPAAARAKPPAAARSRAATRAPAPSSSRYNTAPSSSRSQTRRAATPPSRKPAYRPPAPSRSRSRPSARPSRSRSRRR